MESKKYPFVKCLNPQSIVNPYNNELLLVECGKCQACRTRKGSLAAMRCKLESLSHKYTMFVTLTYNKYTVPRMQIYREHLENYTNTEGKTISYIPRSEYDKLYELTPRLGVGTILGRVVSDDSTLKKLSVKSNMNGTFGHLSKRDAQLFIKRLRKYITKYSDEKIRYYCVGEYGPVSYRPHLHLLLWFSSEEIYKVVRHCIHKAWPYGRIDVQTSVGQSANYVAKYLNGSCSLPRILQEKETKPFALHSNHLGEMVLSKNKKEVYEMPVADFVTRSIPLNGITTDVNLWRSLKTWYFPRCKEYDLRSESERLYAYRLVDEARRCYKSTSLVYLTDSILSDITEFNEDFELLDVNPFTDIDKNKERLIRYFVTSCKINPNDLYLRESYEKYARKIYMELRLSKHFLRDLCDYKDDNIPIIFGYIQRFWKELDYLNLKQSYQNMEEFCEEWYQDESDLQLFYVNVAHDIDNYKTKPYFHNMRFTAEMAHENNVKHKKLNDMNNIFKDR